MAGTLSKGIVLKMATVVVDNVLEIPELGGKVDKVETTCLADASKKYINGIIDYGDLEFKLLYDNSIATSNYRVMKAAEIAGTVKEFTITFPDTTIFTFSGFVTTSVDSAKVGDALQFKLSLTLSTAIVPTMPVA